MRDLLHFFRLSRPLNVFITLLAYGLASYVALRHSLTFFTDPQFWFGALCLTIITGGGYWINDVFDYKIDQINKPDKTIVGPQLSRKKVMTAWIAAMVLVIGFSVWAQPMVLVLINFGVIFLLWLYAWLLKRLSVVGNLLVASMTALVVYYAALLFGFRWPLLWMTIFAFEVTFLREVTKDIEDIRGDLRFKLQTLPIRIGIKGAQKVLYAAYFVFLLSCYLPLADEYFRLGAFNLPYLLFSLIGVQLPVVYLLSLLRKSNKPSDFARQSLLLKLVIFAGMGSILFLT